MIKLFFNHFLLPTNYKRINCTDMLNKRESLQSIRFALALNIILIYKKTHLQFEGVKHMQIISTSIAIGIIISRIIIIKVTLKDI